MKLSKKVAAMAGCAVLLISGTVAGTIAYFTDTDAVANTFTVGKVEITLDEKDTDNDKNTSDNVTINGEVRDKANAYKLMPGHEYIKDPTIRVAEDSEDCYLFVKVENSIEAIEADKKIADQMAALSWKPVDGIENLYVLSKGNENPYAVSKSAEVVVFESFKISGAVDGDTLAKYEEKNKNITVTAYAIQKDGFEDYTPIKIWNATFGASTSANQH